MPPPPPPRLLANLANVTVAVGKPPRTLISRLHLTLREGDRLAIIGKNGVGKTTVARLLATSLGREEFESDRLATNISFEAHRRLIRDEAIEYRESRFDVTYRRATVASYLFPELYPENADDPAMRTPGSSPDGPQGYRPASTRVAPLPVPYDAPSDHPLLAELEAATTGGKTGRLLTQFGLREKRHRPIHALSTGEARKLMIVDYLLSRSRLLVLDEAFDGLDEASRAELDRAIRTALSSEERGESAAVLISHLPEELVPTPTHALLLGQGGDGAEYRVGEWEAMTPHLEAFWAAQEALHVWRPPDNAASTQTAPKPRAPAAPEAWASRNPFASATGARSREATASTPLVEFRGVSVTHPPDVHRDHDSLSISATFTHDGGRLFQQVRVFEGLEWRIHPGENWAVLGGNGSGKSTVLELITGENLQGYQQPVYLFGRRKGSGASIWDIRKQLGILSTATHMDYVDYADPAVRGAGMGRRSGISSWEVVCSGLFDSVGLYRSVTVEQDARCREWVCRLGLEDLVTPPPPGRSRAGAKLAVQPSRQNFFHLSHGEQKLVLLARAMVKRPRLLLLDEPTHGLSGSNRSRMLHALGTLVNTDEVALVYVTHRKDEVETLKLEKVLRLGDGCGFTEEAPE